MSNWKTLYYEDLKQNFKKSNSTPAKEKEYYRVVLDVDSDWDGNAYYVKDVKIETGSHYVKTGTKTFFGNDKYRKVKDTTSIQVYAVKKQYSICEMVTGKRLVTWGDEDKGNIMYCYGVDGPITNTDELVKMADALRKLDEHPELERKYIEALEEYQRKEAYNRKESEAKSKALKAKEEEALQYLKNYR